MAKTKCELLLSGWFYSVYSESVVEIILKTTIEEHLNFVKLVQLFCENKVFWLDFSNGNAPFLCHEKSIIFDELRYELLYELLFHNIIFI